jgi:hypothetical protein
LGVRPAGKKVPDGFPAVEFGRTWTYGMNANELEWYQLLYGCIAKFGPEGGLIRAGTGGVPVDYGYQEPRARGRKTEVKGAQWMFFGASPVPNWRIGYPDVCLCESPRFDVDGYGRVFFPDAARFRVGVLDTNGNFIRWFGSYGNPDSAGRDSAVPTPDIPLYWPYLVEADEGAVYIGDRVNRRIVAVTLRYAATSVCATQ